jgi:hypothetical protein
VILRARARLFRGKALLRTEGTKLTGKSFRFEPGPQLAVILGENA